MYLQRMVCMGMHVLCCLGTQDISMHPDESALTVHLSNEYEVKSVEEKGDMDKEKAYRVDMCVLWDRDVFGRAVEMLGGQQGHVDVEEVETILRAMAGLSTGTESAQVRDTRGAVEVLWDREVFGKAIEKLGGLQSKVDAEKMEAILHAMAYQSTDRVEMLHVSVYMMTVAEWSRGSYKVLCEGHIFEKTYSILIRNEQEEVNAYDIVKILHLMDDLKIQKEWKEACDDKLARKTMKDCKEAAAEYTMTFVKKVVKLWKFLFSHVQDLQGLFVERKTKEDQKETAMGDIENIGKELVKETRKIDNFFLYTQDLLRLFAEKHGMRLTVDDERKTLCLRRSLRKKEQREKRIEDLVLGVEVSEEYRRRTEMQCVAEMLREVMGIAVEVNIEEWKPENREMPSRIISKAKKTGLRIKCGKVNPKAIAQHMQKLKNNILELDVSSNRNLSDEDWKTVGEMTGLERLDISNCSIQAGMIAKYMQNLNLVELDVSSNTSLNDKDWETVGEMTNLERLNIRLCDVQGGTIAKCMQNLNFVELDVSWNTSLSNKDWETVGEMTKLERLNISGCGIQEEQFSRYLGRLRCRIER
eukprot:jgi/Antlo1/572/2265